MHSLFAHQKCVRTKCKCICPSFRKMITLCPAKCRERPTDRIAPDYIYALCSSSLASYGLLSQFLYPSISFGLLGCSSRLTLVTSILCLYVYMLYKLKLIYYLFGSTCASSISLCKVYSCVLASFCSFLIPPQYFILRVFKSCGFV